MRAAEEQEVEMTRSPDSALSWLGMCDSFLARQVRLDAGLDGLRADHACCVISLRSPPSFCPSSAVVSPESRNYVTGLETRPLTLRLLDPPSRLSLTRVARAHSAFDLRSVSLPNAPTLLLLLISRRSRHRPGTRFLRRGIDEHGNVANYVETEQIIVCDPPPPRPSSLEDAEAADGLKSLNGKAGGLDSFSNMLGEGRVKCSFVQVRGSAPVFWGQINNLRYTPDLLVMDLPSTVRHVPPSRIC